jgi:hypothetical protein
MRKGETDEGAVVVASIGTAAMLVLLLVLIVVSGAAERFEKLGLFTDASSQTRFRIYRIFDYLTWNQVVFGVPLHWATYIENTILKLPTSESPVVDMVVQFGVIGTSILIPALFYYFWRLGTKADLYVAMSVIMFLTVTSTNNDFSAKGPAMAFITTLIVSARTVVWARKGGHRTTQELARGEG